jgi:hypothetical protein
MEFLLAHPQTEVYRVDIRIKDIRHRRHSQPEIRFRGVSGTCGARPIVEVGKSENWQLRLIVHRSNRPASNSSKVTFQT